MEEATEQSGAEESVIEQFNNQEDPSHISFALAIILRDKEDDDMVQTLYHNHKIACDLATAYAVGFVAEFKDEGVKALRHAIGFLAFFWGMSVSQVIDIAFDIDENTTLEEL